jgi:hypothetical protein
MLCVACYMASEGANMTEAKFVVGGESLCVDHVAKVTEALDSLPDVTPHN